MTGRRRVAGIAAAVAGAALLLGAVVGLVHAGDDRPPAAALPAAVGRLSPAAPPASSATASATPPAPDARLLLPRFDVAAPVMPVGLSGTVMQVPRDPGRVGWWTGGVAPGAAQGSAVVVGHVNYAGVRGAFGVLARLRPGDRVALTNPDLQFRVVALRSYPKTSGLPAGLFARTGPPRLVLITCGGVFDGASGNYRDNVVVVAERVA